jgi:hypothetical protein
MEALAVFNPAPQEIPTMAKKEDAPTMKKLPAVREAVKTMGVDASVEAVRKWVKENYSLDLTDSVAQNYTSIARKEARAGSNGAAAPARKKRGPKPAAPASAGVDDVVNAVAMLKTLTDKIGKDNVVKLVGAL